MFSAHDPFAGIDLDGCLNATTGELDPDAHEILTLLGGYQERSPSSCGIGTAREERLDFGVP
jgi:primase-polymerase (primpol)-like protein